MKRITCGNPSTKSGKNDVLAAVGVRGEAVVEGLHVLVEGLEVHLLDVRVLLAQVLTFTREGVTFKREGVTFTREGVTFTREGVIFTRKGGHGPCAAASRCACSPWPRAAAP